MLTYTVGGYAPGGVDAIAKPAGGMLTGQVQRLKRFVETGNAARFRFGWPGPDGDSVKPLCLCVSVVNPMCLCVSASLW